MRKENRNRGVFHFILIITILSIILFGCAKRNQSQKKPTVNAGGQKINIAVSLADMERDGNQIIKKTMSGRQGQGGQQGSQSQGGQQGQQSGQQGGQQEQQGGQQAGRQASQETVPAQAGGVPSGSTGQAGGSQGTQGGQQQVNIIWLDAKNDSAQQERDLDQLANQKVKAVVLQPVDASAGPKLVRKLAQANIKVVALETLPVNSPVDGYIASDHSRTGELQARYLMSVSQGRSTPLKVVILQGDRNDQASREITSSVLENLRDNPRIQVVLVKDHPRGDPQMAAATLDQALMSTNNQIDAVVATDARMSAAAAEMLKNRGLSERVITVGVGADQKAAKALANGDHDAEVDVMPDMIAQYAFDAAVGLATTGHWQYDKQVRNGDFDVPAKITPVRLITGDEVYLLEQRWGKLTGQEGRQGGQQGQQGSGNKQTGDQKQDGGGGGSGGGQSGGRKTTLRITTQDGKTVEMQINGEIKKIETVDGGGGKTGGGGQEGGSEGGSGGGEGG